MKHKRMGLDAEFNEKAFLKIQKTLTEHKVTDSCMTVQDTSHCNNSIMKDSTLKKIVSNLEEENESLRIQLSSYKNMPKDLQELQSKCFICKKKLMLTCGTPKVTIGGCCVGAQKGKVHHIFPRHAHMYCYIGMKKRPKLFLKEKEWKGNGTKPTTRRTKGHKK